MPLALALALRDRRADDDVAEQPGHAVVGRRGEPVPHVLEGEREHVGALVEPSVLAVELAHAVLADEMDAELAGADTLALEHRRDQPRDGAGVDGPPRAVGDLDGEPAHDAPSGASLARSPYSL